MSSIYLKSNASGRACDFCSCSINSKPCYGTLKDEQRDICKACIEEMYMDMKQRNLLSAAKSVGESIISMISAVARRLLDKDTKTLIKAGYLSNDLTITEEGQNSLLALSLTSNMKELVALAEEKIAEKEEEKK